MFKKKRVKGKSESEEAQRPASFLTHPDRSRGEEASGGGKQSWLKRHGITLLLVLVLLAGIGIMAYPAASNWWNSIHQSQAIMEYASDVSNMDPKLYKKMLNDAFAYNRRLAVTGVKWHMNSEEKKEYNSLLNVEGTGIMGYITVPEINIELPLYHGTEDSVLQTSIGHLSGTSLPVGGKSTHSTLSGHRGLPSSRLFTDLDKLKKNDVFTITILNRTITYQVDQIRVVKPRERNDLEITNSKDYCTLMTCTPYGINTHRLLVRGRRIPNLDGDADVITEAIRIRPVYIAPFIAAPCVLLMILYLWLSGRAEKRKQGLVRDYLRGQGLTL